MTTSTTTTTTSPSYSIPPYPTMDLRLLRRPVKDLFSARPQCLFSGNTTARRHESSYRRSKQRLNVKPDASFLSSDNQLGDHIIFNPPSAAPSVTHTPLKFLPKDDKRRLLLATTASRLSPAYSRLPPPVDPKHMTPKHHLNEEDIAEILRLRKSDPEAWSRNRLAKKFNCSPVFIGHVVQAPVEKRKIERSQLEAVKAKWGPRRRLAREDRVKRIELAKRDE